MLLLLLPVVAATCADHHDQVIAAAAAAGHTITGCAPIKQYCTDAQHGETVRKFCPATCGECPTAPAPPAPAVPAGAKFTSAQKCPPCGSGAADQYDQEQAQILLDVHNWFRSCTDPPAPPLTWDCEVQCQAQAWAATGNTAHSDSYKLPIKAGENKDSWISKEWPAFAVFRWFDTMYNGVHEYATRGGHYTAIAWKTSKKLGCGWGKQKHGMIFCQYADGPSNWGNADENAGTFDPSKYPACGVKPAMLGAWKNSKKPADLAAAGIHWANGASTVSKAEVLSLPDLKQLFEQRTVIEREDESHLTALFQTQSFGPSPALLVGVCATIMAVALLVRASRAPRREAASEALVEEGESLE